MPEVEQKKLKKIFGMMRVVVISIKKVDKNFYYTSAVYKMRY